NPLTAAKTAMELVVRRPHADNVAQLAGRAIEGLERVDRMIEDLLDLTAVRAGRPLPLRLKKFDARTLVARVCSRLSVSHNKPIELDLTSVEVHWDHEKIERVIENLLGNALKHGDLARPIRVHMDSNYERVRVSVHNFGAVIPPAEHKRIFQPYHRIGAEQGHTHGGWGLGLPLVEGVTHAHGGSVTVESTPETGTLFTLDLPLDVRPLIEERSRF
ncbi:MAG: sensor histidine kinase, partial [Bdellovibrionales bacterium]